ncbi:hypothetical protein BB561_004572 [Smittium simulii]|uniref:Uncharacterized protein n=1 Tax=Smittium simulii TaxID=133385 RepID=A0A2T9YFI6_9FUNG|nr:hypothetical protein BB561_004572 [Smittium simulii]
MSFINKITKKQGEWSSEELKAASFWVLLLSATATGSVCGILGITGFTSIVMAVVTCYLTIGFYWKRYLEIEIEDFGGASEIASEHIAPSISVFFVSCKFE